MTNNRLRFPTFLFDWGNTVMRDYPEITIPMIEWDEVEVIDGIADVLAHLHASRRRIVLATSASISNEKEIWGALKRGGLDRYFSKIYCFQNTNLPKNEAFYRLVGDGFESDVQIPNSLGMFAVWFNSTSNETRESDLHVTVHSMGYLIEFIESLDN